MSAVGKTIIVRPISDSPSPAELPHAIRRALLELVDVGWENDDYRYLLHEYADQYVTAELSGDAVRIWFEDPGGMLGRASEVLAHWIELALPPAFLEGLRRNTVADLGFEVLRIEGPSLARCLVRGPEYPLLYCHGKHWCVVRQRPGDPRAAEAFGDGTLLDVSRLEESAREELDLARYGGRCTCTLCDFAIEARWCSALAGMSTVSDEGARGAAWRLVASDAEVAMLARTAGTAISAWDFAEWTAAPEGPEPLRALVTLLERRSQKAIATLDAAALAANVARFEAP